MLMLPFQQGPQLPRYCPAWVLAQRDVAPADSGWCMPCSQIRRMSRMQKEQFYLFEFALRQQREQQREQQRQQQQNAVPWHG